MGTRGWVIDGFIEVRGARENNLGDVSVDPPKRKLSVFTGFPAPGNRPWSSALFAAESQQLINETYTTFIQSFMPLQVGPDVDALRHLSAAMVVDQERMGDPVSVTGRHLQLRAGTR